MEEMILNLTLQVKLYIKFFCSVSKFNFVVICVLGRKVVVATKLKILYKYIFIKEKSLDDYPS